MNLMSSWINDETLKPFRFLAVYFLVPDSLWNPDIVTPLTCGSWCDFSTIFFGGMESLVNPLGSMYGIFSYIHFYDKFKPNVGKYTIHGPMGIPKQNTSWWFQFLLYVHPCLGKMNPFWLAHIFHHGLVVQPPTTSQVSTSFCWGWSWCA